MKSITFRPLRKKSGKIIVASYMGWRKVMTADYDKFNLIVNDEYKLFSPDEFVYNHKGELLFWFKLLPEDVSFFDSDVIVDFDEKMEYMDTIDRTHKNVAWKMGDRDYFMCRGLDSDGVPTLSFYDGDYLIDRDYNPNDFEPLTVKTVRKWFGWFLFQLKNSYLQIGK